MPDMINCLKGEFGKYGYKFPGMKVGKFLLTLAGIFDKMARSQVKRVGVELKYDITPSLDDLKLDYIPWEKTIIESAWSLIKLGVIPDKTQGPQKK